MFVVARYNLPVIEKQVVGVCNENMHCDGCGLKL
jgi:hypothetical protein